ncbi:SDR family NAD(P)-dependent oxidoreductase [Shewanella sp. GXUN23E]|uniref:SDR family NAD(P)-dependent oxidoreductase n=1 Tax=Shewanella sp. GXUN23E TaxID=3422498 RepID=UPI003D7D12C7
MKVGITGCGWYGMPLARELAACGYQVVGSKRDGAGCRALNDAGIEAVQLDLDDALLAPSLPLVDVDALIINIPPGLRRAENDYLKRLARLKSLLLPNRLARLIFISTTGVYPNMGLVSEEDARADNDSAATLLKAEALFTEAPELLAPGGQVCVLRFAGLIGPGRHPGRFLAGRQDVPGAAQSVNLVHLVDCIAATRCLLTAADAAGIYNLCIPEHRSKQAFYAEAASALGLTAPQFNDVEMADKQIQAQRICRQLGYVYRYPTLASALADC